jgi:hypothetical protein
MTAGKSIASTTAEGVDAATGESAAKRTRRRSRV